MKVTQIPPVHSANLVANSGNTAYGVDVIGPTIPEIWQIKCSTGENAFEINFTKKTPLNKKFLTEFLQNLKTNEDIPTEFVAVFTLSWGQGKFCPASVA